MATVLVLHDVDDVDHWLSSPKREELFGPLGITARTFRGADGSKQVGLIAEIPDMAVWQESCSPRQGRCNEVRRCSPRDDRGPDRGIALRFSAARLNGRAAESWARS
jgi:hypothetical protein